MGGVMGRRRKINSQYPKGVYRKRNTLIYREYLGREGGKARFGPDVYLCPIDAPLSVLHREFERITQREVGTINWLLGKYHISPQFAGLSTRTRSDYDDYRRLLTGYIMANGRPFGEAPLECVTRKTIRSYLDKYGAPIAANRHVQYLKAAWYWALERHDDLPDNPCANVRLNLQPPRDRYVSQAEFQAFMATTSGYIPLFMELAYLCRARWSEVARLKREDMQAEGIRLVRSKGSQGEITAYTPRLLAAIEQCKAFNSEAPTPIGGAYLIHDKRGAAIRQNAFQTAWGRAMREWAAKGGSRFTYHDIKACGYSDQKVQDAGHRSEKMHRTYSRKLRVVEPAE